MHRRCAILAVSGTLAGGYLYPFQAASYAVIFYFIVIGLFTPRLLPMFCNTHELAVKSQILHISANAGKLGASFSRNRDRRH